LDRRRGSNILSAGEKKKGGWRVKESCCLMDEGNIKRMI